MIFKIYFAHSSVKISCLISLYFTFHIFRISSGGTSGDAEVLRQDVARLQGMLDGMLAE